MKKLSCFISASAKADTTSVRKVLANLGVSVLDSYQFDAGDSVFESIKSKIQKCDFALIVVSNSNPSVYYELGICEGIGKPIFLLVEDNFETPPFINKYLFQRANLSELKNLELPIVKFVDELIKNSSNIKYRRKHALTKSKNVDSYIETVQTLRSFGSGQEFERSAVQFFKDLSLSTEALQSNRDRGVDIAVWIDNLRDHFGDIALVELKIGNLKRSSIENGEKQLLKSIEKTQSKLGILLYLDREGKRFEDNHTVFPLIIRYDFEDFVRDINLTSFEEVLLGKRNKMVHGVM